MSIVVNDVTSQGQRARASLVIYVHGFNSSPASFKARLLAQRLAQVNPACEFAAPSLSHWPSEAVASLEALIAHHRRYGVTLVGSSLGGHYATWLAERHGLHAVLVNPAIRPYELLVTELGEQVNLYTGERYQLTAAHLQQLRELEVEAITQPDRYLLIVAAADEVLDSRVARERFAAAQTIVHRGGDHGFADFERYLDTVIAFAARAQGNVSREGG